MPRAKSQIGNRGGRREGAGRKRKLTLSDRRKIVSDYFAACKTVAIWRTSRVVATPSLRIKRQIRCDGSDGCAVPRGILAGYPYKNVQVRNGGGRDTAASGVER